MKIIAFLPKPCGFQNGSDAVFDNVIELFLNIYLFFFCRINRRFYSYFHVPVEQLQVFRSEAAACYISVEPVFFPELTFKRASPARVAHHVEYGCVYIGIAQRWMALMALA